MPDPVPVMILGRLAVDRGFEGRRIGSGLLKDALRRILGVADVVGVRAVLVHAIDEDAVRFYLRFGFVPFPTDGKTLFLPVETIVATLEA
jgi:GNAT superfamily N-acetyltransferase